MFTPKTVIRFRSEQSKLDVCKKSNANNNNFLHRANAASRKTGLNLPSKLMDEHFFKEKIIPLSPLLYSICYKLLGDSDEAKDCVQDVFHKLWVNRKGLAVIKSIEAYTKTITRNTCIDRIRLRKSTLPIEQSVVYEYSDNDSSSYEDVDDRLILVREALASLSEMHQKIFTMRDIEQMEFKDIAIELGLTSENVRVNLSRARKGIKEYVVTKMKVNTK